jgi:hypothetical protein
MAIKPTELLASGLTKMRYDKMRAAKQIKDFLAHKKIYRQILMCFQHDLGDGDVNISSSGRVHCYLPNLDGFTDRKLTMILDSLLYVNGLEPMQTTDYPNCLNRDFRFEFKYGPSWYETIVVSIAAYVREDSPTCRKVLVGTETQTVEKYKIVCDD